MSARQTTRGPARPAAPDFTRPALAPGILGAIALVAFLAVIGDDGWFTVARFVIAILALIMLVFAAQAKQWWWLPPLAAIAVLWNPVLPIDLPLVGWQIAHAAGAVVFVASGLLIKVHRVD